jgi:hypothetical protein
MSINTNIIYFPNKLKRSEEYKKKLYTLIRDDIEKVLNQYSQYYKDSWAVALAAGRFSSMKLQQLEGSKKSLEFFENCIKSQEISKINQ